MPSLPNNEQSCNPHLAALVAINIVTQVLDEAQDIVNTAKDSGKPWRYIWNQKKGNGEFYKNAEILGIVDITGYGKDDDCEINQEDNVIVTTPQKEFDITKNYNDGLIGQGDEDMQTRNTDLRSPSMVINCLFDLSELEQATNFEIAEDIPKDLESQDFLTSTATELVESYVNLALNIVCGDVFIPEQHLIVEDIQGSSHSSYSFLSDAVINDFTENISHNTDNLKHYEENIPSDTQIIKKMDTNEDLEEITKKDIDLYEKTFSTLNRDYDKFSEEDDYIEDHKNLIMQEVELPKNILCSSEDIAVNAVQSKNLIKIEDPATTSVVSDTHKHSLVKRCRLQGARLMSRLRSWWWKQRLIGKRKETRCGLMPGMCPLSPKARNRACSLLDNRKLRSPSPSRAIAWKFNTVNEAFINSYDKKEFEMNSSNPEEGY